MLYKPRTFTEDVHVTRETLLKSMRKAQAEISALTIHGYNSGRASVTLLRQATHGFHAIIDNTVRTYYPYCIIYDAIARTAPRPHLRTVLS